MHAKIHKRGDEILVAAADKDLIGRTLKQGEIVFEVKKTFYGEKTTEDDLRRMFKDAKIGNLIGEKVVKVAIELDLVSEDNLIIIEGVPHAQFVVF